MAAKVEEFATSGTVNWERDFIWVQETSLLQIVGKSKQSVDVRRHDGTCFSLTKYEVELSYFEIRDGSCLKPRYRPVKAHLLSSDQTFSMDGDDATFPEGSAILSRDAIFQVLHKDILMRDYEAVSYPSHERFPETPFPI
jgi:hypothetical protein